MYVVTNPERPTDKGTKTPPNKMTRSRSSGTHMPLRAAFPFSTVASDNLPATAEATKRAYVDFQDIQRAEHVRTEVSESTGEEACAD